MALVGDLVPACRLDLLTLNGLRRPSCWGCKTPYAPCDLGFQLSFCAVLGVQACVQRWPAGKQRAALARMPAGRQGATAPRRADCAFHCADGGAGQSLATLPVLVAQGLAASLVVGAPCQPAGRSGWSSPRWQLGLLSCWLCKLSPCRLPLAAIPNLAASRAEFPAGGLAAAALRAGLRWCAALPLAPSCTCRGEYTLLVLAAAGRAGSLVSGMRRAGCGWYPAGGGGLRSAVAVGLGVLDAARRCAAWRSGRRTAGNPGGRLRAGRAGGGAVPRRGEQPGAPCSSYLAGRSGAAEPALVRWTCARKRHSRWTFDTRAEVVHGAQELRAPSRPGRCLNGLTLDLYHTYRRRTWPW